MTTAPYAGGDTDPPAGLPDAWLPDPDLAARLDARARQLDGAALDVVAIAGAVRACAELRWRAGAATRYEDGVHERVRALGRLVDEIEEAARALRTLGEVAGARAAAVAAALPAPGVGMLP